MWLWIGRLLTATMVRAVTAATGARKGEVEIDDFMHWVAEKPLPIPRPMRLCAMSSHIAARERMSTYFDEISRQGVWLGLPEDWSSVRAPALVIHGDKDRVIHPATAEALAASLPKAEISILAGIGHIPQLEDPRRVARLMEGFLARG